MAIPNKLQEVLVQHNAVLLRSNHHHVYRLPNGYQLTVSHTASDNRATQNNISLLRRLSALPPRRSTKAGTP